MPSVLSSPVVLAGILLVTAGPLLAQPPAGPRDADRKAPHPESALVDCDHSTRGSPYIPVDSWIYPAVLRLYSMGYVDLVYLGMRPWTHAAVSHVLEEAAP